MKINSKINENRFKNLKNECFWAFYAQIWAKNKFSKKIGLPQWFVLKIINRMQKFKAI